MIPDGNQFDPRLSPAEAALMELDQPAGDCCEESKSDGSSTEKTTTPKISDALRASVSEALRKIKFAFNAANVYPGQDDREIARLMKEWMERTGKDLKAARYRYAGALGSTQPVEGDYECRDDFEVQKRAWYHESCTELQRKILKDARQQRKAKVNALKREEYKREKNAKGQEVRPYVRHADDEERWEARKLQDREAKRRQRERDRQADPEALARRKAANQEKQRLREEEEATIPEDLRAINDHFKKQPLYRRAKLPPLAG